jgi:hypothetical protein
VHIAEYERKIAELERKVGQLTMEVDLLKKGAQLGRQYVRPYATRASGRTTQRFASDCGSWPRNAAASGIGDWAGCWPAKVM